MKCHPLFSVLIASYNNDKYIDSAIESVISQTYDNWEIIIVDDCSEDSSKEQLRKYTDNPLINIFYNLTNKGCGYTKKRLAELANGELLGFLDSDDALTVDALATMVEQHQMFPDASIVCSSRYVTDENLQVKYIDGGGESIQGDQTFLTQRTGISHFVSFKKNKYQLTEGINPYMKKAEDRDLYYKLEEVGSIVKIDEPLYYYRTDTGNNVSLNKSLSDDNLELAHAWDMYAMVNACIRRNIDIEKFALKYYSQFIKWGKESVYQSKTYRIGYFIKHLSCIKKHEK